MTRRSPSLSLDQCVETLKRQLPVVSKATPKELALLYAAAVGLLCHLKKDQATLRAALKAASDQQVIMPCPPDEEIPAVARILQDSQLFLTLVACLKVPTDATDASSTSAGGSGDSARTGNTPRYNRKRSYSLQSDLPDQPPASKMLKLQHSPKKPAAKVASGWGAATSADNRPASPSIPIGVLAATLLYSAFQHVDHWPAQLVQAYAEDAFGPRLWVDDERCSLLVQNLATSHCNDMGQEESPVDTATLDHASLVAHYYEQLSLEPTNGSTSVPDSRPAVLTPPQSIVERPRSMSFGSTEVASSTALASDSDSDSGDDMDCLIEVSSGRLAKAGNGGDDDSSSSSSSGMSGAEVVEMSTTLEETSSFTAPPSRPALLASSAASTPKPVAIFPGTPVSLNLERVRRRYVGINMDHAQQAITSALSDRLDIRSKQNSKLLMALPSFLSIPAVRRLTARHLERWLQSPALSGQARALFAATVQHMRDVDPPLPDDIQAIDSILEMRLKANQVNMHIENVTEIAKRIPNVTVVKHIFLRILREELAIMESAAHSSSPMEPMKMLHAVYGATDGSRACEGLAIAFSTLLAEPPSEVGRDDDSQRERHIRVGRTRSLLRHVASALGSKFDGCGLIQCLSSFESSNSWSLEDEEDKARLMYECATLLASSPSADDPGTRQKGQRKHHRHSDERADEEVVSLRSKLKKARRLLLSWCCNEYAPRWQERHRKRREHDDRVMGTLSNGGDHEAFATGVGAPDFRSVLGGGGWSLKFKECLDVMRCVLFVVDAESATLRDFLFPGDGLEVHDPKWHDTQYRIKQCNEYGTDLDDEMLWIILKSAVLSNDGIDASLALSLTESLFECCNKDRRAVLNITDEKLVWELYRLSECFPSSLRNGISEGSLHVPNNSNFPRLANPGRWWRVTMLVLVMCGVSPEGIGTIMFRVHPTVRALIKMVTSGRYRFPTIDCNEVDRSEMKTADLAAREEESQIAEVLFLPPAPTPRDIEMTDNGTASIKRGVRASARQRDKQERLERQRREEEAVAALAGANRRKRLLRAAQKSVMLWDQKGAARKPPKEAVPLILAVNDHFALSEVFRQNVDPDFLLMTIGETSRASIEMAFHWLIPVISSVPDSIQRLPANASCFLLLRAYGEEGEGQSELRELSAPLVEHVKKSLTGKFGESSAVRSADLLLADLADPNPDRRRCVIRVLRETLGTRVPDDGDDSTGLLCLLEVDHAEAIVAGAISYISQGLSFESGSTLRALVIALENYISFAAEKSREGPWNFASIICQLISRRHNICADAMDRFPDFRSLAISLIYGEFLEYVNGSRTNRTADEQEWVVIQLCSGAIGDDDSPRKHLFMPLALLQSICVLLSLWDDEKKDTVSSTLNAAIQYFADALLYPFDNSDVGTENFTGLASARFEGSGDAAVTAEKWVMLAKSRSGLIARRAALSAPTEFLPRLILCSGLPASSLLTMVDRLGKLGEKAEDRDRVFKELLSIGTNQWATSYPGSRKEMTRKLVGRLSAYLRLNQASWEQTISRSFLDWLSEECSNQAKARKTRPNRKRVDQTALSQVVNSASRGRLVSTLGNVELLVDEDVPKLVEGSTIVLESFDASPDIGGKPSATDALDRNGALIFIEECFTGNQPVALNEWLNAVYSQSTLTSATMESDPALLDCVSVCISLLKTFYKESHHSNGWFANMVLRWVPTLSQTRGGPEFWSQIFSSHPDVHASSELLCNRCASIWCQAHAQECQQWILANHDGLSVSSIMRFLIATSYQLSIHAQSFIGSTLLHTEGYWGSSESGLRAGVTIALKGAKEPCVFNVDDPMILPDWLTMLLLLAKSRDGSVMKVCEMLLQAIQNAENLQFRTSLQSAMLRMYTHFPTKMKLANPMLRGVLMEGAKAGRWLTWRSSLDAQLDDMLSSLKNSSSKRIIQCLTDLSKAHPLLILRKLPNVTLLLENDASVPTINNMASLRGRVYGENLLGPLQAVTSMAGGGKTGATAPVKVFVRHWGYSYTEGLWISVMDILLSIPKEVLFSCGMRMGGALGELLGVYAKLLFVQSQLQQSATTTSNNTSSSSRVKTKFSSLLNDFRATDVQDWEFWLSSKARGLPSLDTMRNVLLSCSLIAPQAASVESLQKAMAQSS